MACGATHTASASLVPQLRLISARFSSRAEARLRSPRVHQWCMSHRGQAKAWSWTSLSRVPFRIERPLPDRNRLGVSLAARRVSVASGDLSPAEAALMSPSCCRCPALLKLLTPTEAVARCPRVLGRSVRSRLHRPDRNRCCAPFLVRKPLRTSAPFRPKPLWSDCPSRVALPSFPSRPEGRSVLPFQTVADSPSAVPAYAAPASDSPAHS